MLENHLRKAKAHAALGKESIGRQKALIEELKRDGHDTALALELLATFEQLQAMNVADVERIEHEIASGDDESSSIARSVWARPRRH